MDIVQWTAKQRGTIFHFREQVSTAVQYRMLYITASDTASCTWWCKVCRYLALKIHSINLCIGCSWAHLKAKRRRSVVTDAAEGWRSLHTVGLAIRWPHSVILMWSTNSLLSCWCFYSHFVIMLVTADCEILKSEQRLDSLHRSDTIMLQHSQAGKLLGSPFFHKCLQKQAACLGLYACVLGCD